MKVKNSELFVKCLELIRAIEENVVDISTKENVVLQEQILKILAEDLEKVEKSSINLLSYFDKE